MPQKAQIEEFNPVDGKFFLINRSDTGSLFAKAWTMEDARLISASQDMLKALQALNESGGLDGGTPEAIKARQAIIKATGKLLPPRQKLEFEQDKADITDEPYDDSEERWAAYRAMRDREIGYNP